MSQTQAHTYTTNIQYSTRTRRSPCCSFCGLIGHRVNKCNSEEISQFVNQLKSFVYDDDTLFELINTAPIAIINIVLSTHLGFKYNIACQISHQTKKNYIVNYIRSLIPDNTPHSTRGVTFRRPPRPPRPPRFPMYPQDRYDSETSITMPINFPTTTSTLTITIPNPAFVFGRQNATLGLPPPPTQNNINKIQPLLLVDQEETPLDRCSICFGDDISTHEITTTNCNHTYCQQCICKWIDIANRADTHVKCPTCRHQITTLTLRDVEYFKQINDKYNF